MHAAFAIGSILLLVVVGLDVTRATDCSKKGREHDLADGCTGIQFPGLTLACDKHDICYNCGAKSGISRLGCDEILLNNVHNICNKLPFIDRLVCHTAGAVLYRLARVNGVSLYEYRTSETCEMDWVPECLY